MPKKPARQKRGSKPSRKIGIAGTIKWLTVGAIWSAIGLAGVLAYYAYDLPNVDRLGDRQRTPSVTVIAQNGTVLARFGDLYGPPIDVAAMPPHLPHAVLAIEDRRFYRHFGLDPLALLRASMANLKAGRIVQGGSTITQQLAKTIFLTPARTLRRKVQELLLALWLERKFTKDELLTIYLNRVYLGAGAFGVEAASRRYFDKSARNVGLAEAAMLAGLLQAPTRLAPSRNLAAARQRARVVLGAMARTGYIDTAAEARAAERPATVVEARNVGTGSRYFADWVLDQVRDFAGPTAADLIVQSTLDPLVQRAAESAVTSILKAEGNRRRVGQAALTALSPNGSVRAMVGGREYAHSQFNRAVQSLRQPGSAFKLFVYLAALEEGFGPDTVIDDAPITIGGWTPRNYDGRYHGPVTLQNAVARSLNSVAVRIGESIGRGKVVQLARRLGITAKLRADPSLALGTSEIALIELTAAYASLTNHGLGVWAYGIEEIRTSEGTVLYRRSGSGPGAVLDERTRREMLAMLRAVISQGTGRAASLPWPIAGKTGTSQDFRDAWFVGISGDLVAGVWMGNDNGAAMDKVTGGGLPARLWAQFMRAAQPGKRAPRPPVGPRTRPRKRLRSHCPLLEMTPYRLDHDVGRRAVGKGSNMFATLSHQVDLATVIHKIVATIARIIGLAKIDSVSLGNRRNLCRRARQSE